MKTLLNVDGLLLKWNELHQNGSVLLYRSLSKNTHISLEEHSILRNHFPDHRQGAKIFTGSQQRPALLALTSELAASCQDLGSDQSFSCGKRGLLPEKIMFHKEVSPDSLSSCPFLTVPIPDITNQASDHRVVSSWRFKDARSKVE